MSEAERSAAVHRAVTLSDFDLLSELGSVGMDMFPSDAADKGLKILSRAMQSLRDSVCGNQHIRELVETEADELALASALADLIAALTQHLPAATVAVLMVRQGITRYCSSDWSP